MAAFDPRQTFFELFQLPQHFQVDQAQLTSRYKHLQREAHPDRFAGGSERERLLAVQYSAWINEAYNTLRSPVLRAQYLLSLEGINISPDQTMANDPAFLMHQITLREQLQTLKEHPDPEQALDDLTTKLDKLIAQQCAEFQSSYDNKNYQQASERVMKMQFLYKLEEDTRRAEADILDY